MAVETPPGWYPDPGDPSRTRYWTGEAWTEEVQPAEASAPPPPPDEPTSSARTALLVVGGALAAVAVGVGAALLLQGGDDGGGEEVVAVAADGDVPEASTTSAPTTTVPPATTAPPPTTAPAVSGQGSRGLKRAFDTYVQGINSADYASAYAVLGPNAQGLTSFSEFVDGNETSEISGFTVDAVRPAGQGRSTVDVSFTSNQAASKGPDGQTCTKWQLTYAMVAIDGAWRIDRADTRNGTPRGC